MHQTAAYWIEKLGLQQHPEGGYFKETYRSGGKLPPDEQGKIRNCATAIYFLLFGDKFSAFHRIRSDEMWHFYDGDPVEIFYFDHTGVLHTMLLGNDMEQGATFQTWIPGGCWFASRMAVSDGYALVGCTVAPGFDFEDFEMADRNQLLKEHPEHAQLIASLTYPSG